MNEGRGGSTALRVAPWMSWPWAQIPLIGPAAAGGENHARTTTTMKGQPHPCGANRVWSEWQAATRHDETRQEVGSALRPRPLRSKVERGRGGQCSIALGMRCDRSPIPPMVSLTGHQ